jgi:hypothetical protein
MRADPSAPSLRSCRGWLCFALGLLVCAVFVASTGWGGSAAASGGTSGTGACALKRDKLLLRNGVVLVARDSPIDGGQTYSCALRSGNEIGLDGPSESRAFKPPAMALAGYKLAYAVETLDNESRGYTDVWVIDTRDVTLEAQGNGTRIPIRETKVGSLVLHYSGAVAWISCRGERFGNGAFGPYCRSPGAPDRVWRFSPGTDEPELLDRGRDIDPSSLRRRGERICWTTTSRRRCATLR